MPSSRSHRSELRADLPFVVAGVVLVIVLAALGLSVLSSYLHDYRSGDRQSNRTEKQVRERLMGFEPTTFCMASRRSSQLSYSREGRRV